MPAEDRAPQTPLRLLIVMPNWLGDAVMATPALRLVRRSFPGIFIGGLMRPGVAEVLEGSTLLDEIHPDHSRGVMAPKLAAAKVRPRRYDAALLLRNSFSSALVARLAGIPRRLGYATDARGMLLTESLKPTGRARAELPLIPIANHYHRLAWKLLVEPAHIPASVTGDLPPGPPDTLAPTPEGRRDPSRLAWPLPQGTRLELGVSPAQAQAAADLLRKAGVAPGERLALLNPGASKEYKRWPTERFAAVADHLAEKHALRVLINGSPAEAELGAAIASLAKAPVVPLAPLGMTVGALKGILAQRESPIDAMVTGDTGPRHLAAAFGVPLITLFGSTDPRLTKLPLTGPEVGVESRPDLPEEEIYDDHPDDCRIDRIAVDAVIAAADRLLAGTRPHTTLTTS